MSYLLRKLYKFSCFVGCEFNNLRIISIRRKYFIFYCLFKRVCKHDLAIVSHQTIVFFLVVNAFDLLTGFLPVIYYATLAMSVFSGLHYIFHINRLMSEGQREDPTE